MKAIDESNMRESGVLEAAKLPAAAVIELKKKKGVSRWLCVCSWPNQWVN